MKKFILIVITIILFTGLIYPADGANSNSQTEYSTGNQGENALRDAEIQKALNAFKIQSGDKLEIQYFESSDGKKYIRSFIMHINQRKFRFCLFSVFRPFYIDWDDLKSLEKVIKVTSEITRQNYSAFLKNIKTFDDFSMYSENEKKFNTLTEGTAIAERIVENFNAYLAESEENREKVSTVFLEMVRQEIIDDAREGYEHNKIMKSLNKKKLLNIGFSFTFSQFAFQMGHAEYIIRIMPSLLIEYYFLKADARINPGIQFNIGYVNQSLITQHYLSMGIHFAVDFFGTRHKDRLHLALGFETDFRVKGERFAIYKDYDYSPRGRLLKNFLYGLSFEIGGKFYNSNMTYCFYFNFYFKLINKLWDDAPRNSNIMFGFNAGFLVNLF